jgi:acyl-coenzyme A thioesterase PaaI-like protein
MKAAMKNKSLQELNRIDECFGCGTQNKNGLGIKSYWDGNESVCVWQAESHHCGATADRVYGGIIASLIDCHSVNTATFEAYRNESREAGSEPVLRYVTGNLDVSFLRPTPINKPFHIHAKVVKMEGRKIWVESKLTCEGKLCAQGKVLAVRVNADSAK